MNVLTRIRKSTSGKIEPEEGPHSDFTGDFRVNAIQFLEAGDIPET